MREAACSRVVEARGDEEGDAELEEAEQLVEARVLAEKDGLVIAEDLREDAEQLGQARAASIPRLDRATLFDE